MTQAEIIRVQQRRGPLEFKDEHADANRYIVCPHAKGRHCHPPLPPRGVIQARRKEVCPLFFENKTANQGFFRPICKKKANVEGGSWEVSRKDGCGTGANKKLRAAERRVHRRAWKARPEGQSPQLAWRRGRSGITRAPVQCIEQPAKFSCWRCCGDGLKHVRGPMSPWVSIESHD